MTALPAWEERNHARLADVRVALARRFGPKPIPTLHEYISASHSMLLVLYVAQRKPPRPEFVHCWGCRVPVTPSGRKFIVDGTAWPTRRNAEPHMFDTTCRMMRRVNTKRSATPAQAKGVL